MEGDEEAVQTQYEEYKKRVDPKLLAGVGLTDWPMLHAEMMKDTKNPEAKEGVVQFLWVKRVGVGESYTAL